MNVFEIGELSKEERRELYEKMKTSDDLPFDILWESAHGEVLEIYDYLNKVSQRFSIAFILF